MKSVFNNPLQHSLTKLNKQIMDKKFKYEVLTYDTKDDFDSCKNFDTADEGLLKKDAIAYAKKLSKSGDFYAVKWRSFDGEESEIFFKSKDDNL